MTRGNTGSARALSKMAQLESARTPRGATTKLKKFIAEERGDSLMAVRTGSPQPQHRSSKTRFRVAFRASRDPREEDFSRASDGMDHVQVDRLVVRLSDRPADRRVMAAKILVVQARVETLRHRSRRVPGPRNHTVQPMVEFGHAAVR